MIAHRRVSLGDLQQGHDSWVDCWMAIDRNKGDMIRNAARNSFFASAQGGAQGLSVCTMMCGTYFIVWHTHWYYYAVFDNVVSVLRLLPHGSATYLHILSDISDNVKVLGYSIYYTQFVCPRWICDDRWVCRQRIQGAIEPEKAHRTVSFISLVHPYSVYR